MCTSQVTSIERGTITQKQLDEALGESHATPEVLYVLSHNPTLCGSTNMKLLVSILSIPSCALLASG